MSDCSSFGDCKVISIYLRAQALEDGVLVDVTEWAQGLFKVPVALTSALWGTLEQVPEDSGEDIRGRVYDVLFLAALSAKRAFESRISFQVLVNPKMLTLVMEIGPGDEGEAVITIGFPEDF